LDGSLPKICKAVRPFDQDGNIYQKQIKYHVFNAVTNSELTELVPVFTTRPAFPTSVKKVNTSFKNVWRTYAGRVVNTGTSSVNSEFVTALIYVIFDLFLVNIIGNCHENKYI
jgi:hypothetical protein